MRRMITVAVVLMMGVTANFGQTPMFTEDFETGTPSTEWELYREGEEPIEAVAMASVPIPLANGGSYVGLVQDADVSYSGSGIALAGTVDDSNYTVEADVYVYTNHPDGSAYTGLIAYADSSRGVYIKLAADFDADMRFRLYNNQLNTTTFQYTFHHSIDASDVDTTEGWHHMKVDVETQPDGTTAYTCFYDGSMIGDGAYIDTSSSRLASGQWGLWAFQMDADGIAGYFDNVKVYGYSDTPIAIREDDNAGSTVPVNFALLQNYPNPFNPSTSIEFTLREGSRVTLNVYDLNGKLIRTLMEGFLAPRNYSVIWDGRDMTGRLVPSGVYIYRITDGIRNEAKRMVLLK